MKLHQVEYEKSSTCFKQAQKKRLPSEVSLFFL